VKEKPTLGSPFLRTFVLTTSLRWQRMSLYISLFTAAIPLNYTSEFWEFFEATMSFKLVFQSMAVGCEFKC